MDHVYRLFLAVLLTHCVTSYQEFRKRIPNGFSVPHPCQPGRVWLGVGHFDSFGTGSWNNFGVDFGHANNIWTVEVCRADSDGDGVANGVELGDPDCIWKEGDTPTFTDGISHPGICDPWNSTFCEQKNFTGYSYNNQKEWLDTECKTPEFECPALNDDGVQNATIRLPSGSVVPAEDTTYTCIMVDLPSLGIPTDQDFHVVAIRPILDNKHVVHHMIMTGCTDNRVVSPNPYACEAVTPLMCPEILHFWTVGFSGECFHPMNGIRFGPSGLKTFILQVHWNNPGLLTGLTDSSGVAIYYTPHLRPHDAGVLLIGTPLFVLPPKQAEVQVDSTCSSQCTQRRMLGPVNVTSAWNYMHYSGKRMNIQVTRDQQHLTNLTQEKLYNYYTPRVHRFPSDFVLYPGDELRTRCVFNTLVFNRTIISGFNARDEMCLGMITYFPKQNMAMSTCLDYLGVSMCTNETWGECRDLPKFVERIKTTDVYRDVLDHCRSFVPCVAECVQAIVKHVRSESCLQGRIWEYIQNTLTSVPDGREFLSRLASCKVEVHLALNSSLTSDLD